MIFFSALWSPDGITDQLFFETKSEAEEFVKWRNNQSDVKSPFYEWSVEECNTMTVDQAMKHELEEEKEFKEMLSRIKKQ